MGGILNASEATSTLTLPSLSSFTMPAISTTNLAGLYLFDSSERTTNWAGGAALTAIGVPVVGARSVTLSGANGYETGIAEAEAMTVAVIVKAKTTGSDLIVHNQNAGSSSPNGLALYFGDGGGGSAARAGVKNAAGTYQQVFVSAALAGATAGEWNILLGTYSAAEVRVGWSADGVLYENAAAVTGGRTLAGTLRIGGASTGGAWSGEFEIMGAAIYTEALDATKRGTLLANMRAWLAEGGITTG
jgi:hypothetical protein